MDCILIVNANGKLSACPTVEQFVTHEFITQSMVTFAIEVSPVVLVALKLAADVLWVAGAGLPEPISKPDRKWLVVANGLLYHLPI